METHNANHVYFLPLLCVSSRGLLSYTERSNLVNHIGSRIRRANNKSVVDVIDCEDCAATENSDNNFENSVNSQTIDRDYVDQHF